ncbi:Uncharacterized protein TCM_013170 [Theobroma cacao]|uniref:Uncharacterized protein n=1 Tax=Theobroma cacao TaxID=3641 RepID=A0A061FW69_THECC|nr:Uncharacterized protein TCM_013170 [Theobroma cacao]
MWEVITGKREKFPSRSYTSEIKNAQLRILHYFIATILHGRSSSFSYVSAQDLWLMEAVFNEITQNVGRYMVKRIKTTTLRDKANLSYGNIITTLVKKKRIWSGRFQYDLMKNKDQGIFLGSVLKMGHKIEKNECIKITKGTPLAPSTGSHSTPFTRVSQLLLQSDMMLNLLMRIDGKLTDQAEKMEKIQEKLQQLEALLNPAKETNVSETPISVVSQSSERTTTKQFESAISSHDKKTKKETPKNPDVI